MLFKKVTEAMQKYIGVTHPLIHPGLPQSCKVTLCEFKIGIPFSR